MRVIRCDCSRCNLYLKVTTDQDFDYNSQAELKKICFEDRKYQTALIEYGKSHNIMACLPTGSGKTFIALKLIEHFQPDIAGGKKVFFLANTIPLVNQQASFIARNSSFKVRHLTGDMGVDYWTAESWESIIQTFDVMAMTSMIFLNMLRHEYIRLSQIALLIFDECHHAVGDHPMNNIMKEYARAKQMEANYPVPRILGLSATIIKGTCKPSQVSNKIIELEGALNSAAITYKDYEEVLNHSTSSIVERVMVSDNHDFNHIDYTIISDMENLSKELQDFRKQRKKEKMQAAKVSPNNIDPGLKSFDNVYNLMQIKPSPGDLKVALDDVLHAYKDLGLYCACIAVNLRLAYIEFSLMDINSESVKKWYEKVRDHLQTVRTYILTKMSDNESDEKKYVLRFISPKVKSLLKILETYKAFESTPECEFESNRLCGLIFTDRRATAQVLAWYLKDLSKNSEADHGFLRAGFVVGTSRSAFESVESRVYARKQTETLNNFRVKNLNLLTATSVLEEGIDVPSCNFVVRFDPVQTYTSYIQSMGRARKKDAKFYAMLPEKDFFKLSAKLDEFQEVNKAITAHLQRNVDKIDADLHTIRSFWEADLIPPICPGGTVDSPKITMDSASDVVERYCNLLPCDGISTMQAMSWWNECSTRNQYQASLKLPLSGPIKETIVGIPMKDKELARQAVYMEAARRLLDEKCLDSKLIPFHPVLPIKISKYFKNLVPFGEGSEEDDEPEPGEVKDNEKEPAAGGEPSSDEVIYRNEWYLKRQPKWMEEPRLRPGGEVHVYKINFELAQERADSLWKNLYEFKNSEVGFAIITSQILPNVGVFPLFGAFGTIHCTLTSVKLRNFELDERLHERLRFAQHRLFSDILGLKHPMLGNKRDASFLIAGIINKGGKGWKIDERIEEDLKELDTIQSTRRPQRPRDQSRNRAPPKTVSSLHQKYHNSVVFPWYKKPKPAYLVDCVMPDMTPMREFQGGTYKNFVETEYRVKIQDPNQPLLKCKLAGIAVGRSEKDPLQMNYLLQKFSKEDEYIVYMVPELVYSIEMSATFFVQLKLIPSVLHRLSRLTLASELLSECTVMTGWPKERNSFVAMPDASELKLISSTHEKQKKEEAERRKRRVEERNEKFCVKKLKPLSKKLHMEQRELHYEFIHPNDITKKLIQLFHEAVSIHHSARKLTLKSVEVELISANLSLPSEFELQNINDIVLESLDKPLNPNDTGPSLLSIMEALSWKMSNEGLSGERFEPIGSSFMTFATSLFAFSNFPSYGEPMLCQFRNGLLTLRVLLQFCKRKGLPEIVCGSDFHPGASWFPPGKQINPSYLGEIAASNKMHTNIFDELFSQNPRDRHKINDMSREELEKFAGHKATQPPQPEPTIPQGRKSLPNNKKKPLSSFKHATFTHGELSDFEIVHRLNSLVGAFFASNGTQGGYKALEWLQIQVPDWEGTPRNLNDLTRAQPGTGPTDNSTGHELFSQFEPVEETIQYKFRNKSLLLQAFTHPSYPGHNLADCYQRLEFLGDGILDLLVTNHVYSQHTEGSGPTADELKSIRLAFNSVTYASLAVRYGFQKYLLSMSKPLLDIIDNFVIYQESVEHHVLGHFNLVTDAECRGPKHVEVPSVLCDVWEALAGAIFLDSGNSLDTVWRVFYRLMQHELDIFWETKPQSPIYELKAWLKLKENEGIEMKFQGFSGEKTKARGRECCKIELGPHGRYFGMGTNFPRAKEAAAKLAWKLIKEEEAFIKNRDGATSIMLLTC